jgi:spore cortex formation protein SpoVR/YcgB (stage V sporulation)
MELFVYEQLQMPSGDIIIEIVSKKLDDVVEYLCKDLYNYRSPVLSIVSANSWGLEIDHESTEIGTLDASHIKKVMSYLYEIWGSPIDVKTVDDNGTTIHLTIDEEGFSF